MNGVTKKWLVYKEKSHLEMDDFCWYPYFPGNLHMKNSRIDIADSAKMMTCGGHIMTGIILLKYDM